MSPSERCIASIISFSAGSTIARASSGSSPSIKSIDPLISANSAVTVLRSPPEASAASCSNLTRTAGSTIVEGYLTLAMGSRATVSPIPHSPQNLNSAGFSSPQREHRFRSAAPHPPQNFIPEGFSVPQLEHRIAMSLSRQQACTQPLTEHSDDSEILNPDLSFSEGLLHDSRGALPLSRGERIEGEGPCSARIFRARFRILLLLRKHTEVTQIGPGEEVLHN